MIARNPDFEVKLGAQYDTVIAPYQITGWEYRYFIRDQQNSPRIEFKDDNGVAKTVAVYNYYPGNGVALWDESASTATINNYHHGGQETQRSFGLGYARYDYRLADRWLNRFIAPDPISNEFAHVTTYNLAENRGANAVDLWGLQSYSVHDIATNIMGNDNVGLITTASESTRNTSPLLAGVQDFSFLMLDLIGVNSIDNAISNGNTTEVVASILSAGLVTKNGKTRVASGGSPRVNLKTGKVSKAGQFTEKNSLALDPQGPTHKSGTIQKVGESNLEVAPNANSLRLGDPLASPTVSGKAGKAAVISIGGGILINSVGNTLKEGQKTQLIVNQNLNNVTPSDNTRVRIPIIQMDKNEY